jgi:hypothetical protein
VGEGACVEIGAADAETEGDVRDVQLQEVAVGIGAIAGAEGRDGLQNAGGLTDQFEAEGGNGLLAEEVDFEDFGLAAEGRAVRGKVRRTFVSGLEVLERDAEDGDFVGGARGGDVVERAGLGESVYPHES